MDTLLLPLHLLILAFIVWNVVAADHLGFTWIRGKKETLDEEVVIKYHKRLLVGLFLMIATGALLFWPMREFLFTRKQFFVKLMFIFVLICNSYAIGRLQKITFTRTFASLSTKEKIPLFISGAVSTIAWLGAIAGGYFLMPD